jgi:uncharacterized protein (TIGR02186 family)
MKQLLLSIVLAALPMSAQAQGLVAGISQDQIQITSSYSGADVVVFGDIQQQTDSSENSPAGKPDVVVVVRGQSEDMAVRRKAHVAAVWVNSAKITLNNIPAYYFAASTRPLPQIASAQTLKLYQIGASNVQPQGASTANNAKLEPFRRAFIALRKRDLLYIEAPRGVEFLGPTLFRVHVPVPAGAPQGQYTVEVYVIRNGQILDVQSTPFFVDQIGLERDLHHFAFHWPLTYGLVTVLMALLLGWLSSAIFRQA